MPIAAKLLYFQRRRPPPLPEPTDPLSRDSSAARLRVHHRPSYEVVRGSHRERGASSGCITESTRKTLSSTRQSSNASDDRLPDAVQQAKERLHQRLRSVDLFPGRRSTSACGSQRWQTAPASRSIWDGPSLPSESNICTSEDGRLDDRTIRLSSRGSLSAHKPKQMTAEIFIDTAVAATHPRPISELGHGTFQGTIKGEESVESSVDCSICLEGCHGAAGGLIQLRCKHIFHSACLEQWLQSRADCPYCRAGVVLPRKE